MKDRKILLNPMSLGPRVQLNWSNIEFGLALDRLDACPSWPIRRTTIQTHCHPYTQRSISKGKTIFEKKTLITNIFIYV